jgi:succinyl-CoA synthetase beta subunit
MARLYEYQGKSLLKECGIHVPRGYLVSSSRDVVRENENLNFPVVIKSQVLSGNRNVMGGISFADNVQELESQTTKLFSTKIGGLSAEKLLIEEKVGIKSEYYLGISADPGARCPVAILSSKGGTGIEEVFKTEPQRARKMNINILKGFRRYEAIYLVSSLPEIPLKQVLPLADLLVDLYKMFRRFDCRLVEINPVAYTDEGFVAVDCRIEIDDDAIYRQGHLELESAEEGGDRLPNALEVAAGAIDHNDHRGTAHFVQLDSDGSYINSLNKIPIGFNCVGTGSSLVTMDELVPLGYYPVNFADTSGNPTASKLYRMTRIIFAQHHIKGYLFVSCISSQQLDNTARGIIKALLDLYPDTGGIPPIPFVVVLRGAFEDVALDLFKRHGITGAPWVKVMGRETSEKDAAHAFDQLYKLWEKKRGDRR